MPSAYGQRFAYGHIREEGRDLIVSAGLGCSIVPVRLGVPPELTVVTLRRADYDQIRARIRNGPTKCPRLRVREQNRWAYLLEQRHDGIPVQRLL